MGTYVNSRGLILEADDFDMFLPSLLEEYCDCGGTLVRIYSKYVEYNCLDCNYLYTWLDVRDWILDYNL